MLSFLGRLFFRYVLPWWLRRFMKKKQEEFNRQYYSQQNPSSEDGTYIHKDKSDGQVNPDVGEYIDYEEIDDNND